MKDFRRRRCASSAREQTHSRGKECEIGKALADKSEVALTNANGGNRFHGTVDMLETILRPSEAEPEA